MVIVGSLFALPNELLFFAVWIAASLVRPMCLLTTLCVLSNPKAAYRKFLLFVSTVQYLAFCNDKKWKTPQDDPASFFKKAAEDGKVTKKTIIFVRHGESSWNDSFNKGDRSTLNFIVNFIPNLIYAVFVEWYFWVAGKATESWFFDSPLSEKGKRQAETVKKFLQSDPAYLTPKEANLVKLLRGGDININNDNDTSNGATTTTTKGGNRCCSGQLLSSNLRRAIATMAIGFQDRFSQHYDNDKMLILPCLQEISRNPDALSITPSQQKVVPAWTDPKALADIYENQVDTSKHLGNKPVNSNGLKRMQEFCRIVFQDIEKDAVICGGHSLWFRSFFRTYLPRTNNHIAKKKKLVNGGVVGFTLERVETTTSTTTNGNKEYQYMIDPTSIVVLHGGF